VEVELVVEMLEVVEVLAVWFYTLEYKFVEIHLTL
jgi:hypothetical protein